MLHLYLITKYSSRNTPIYTVFGTHFNLDNLSSMLLNTENVTFYVLSTLYASPTEITSRRQTAQVYRF